MIALYVYIAFSYLYMIGYKYGRDYVADSGAGWIIPTILAPLFLPFILGCHEGAGEE